MLVLRIWRYIKNLLGNLDSCQLFFPNYKFTVYLHHNVRPLLSFNWIICGTSEKNVTCWSDRDVNGDFWTTAARSVLWNPEKQNTTTLLYSKLSTGSPQNCVYELRPHNKIFQGGGGGRNLYWFSLGLKKVGNNLTNYWNFFSWRRNWKPSQSYLFCASSFVLPLEWIAIEMPVSDILIFLDLLFLHENKYSHVINV